jgi:osomolarity two-component system, response regulator SKN7
MDWSNDGRAVVIKDMLNFSRQVLPQLFKHSNFQSFVRLMNKYDFHKTKLSSEEEEAYVAQCPESLGQKVFF